MSRPQTLKEILARFNLDPEADYRGRPMPLHLVGKTRLDLAALLAELGCDRGAEIGVERGEYSEALLTANPRLRLSAVDAWRAYRGYRDHTTQAKLDGFYAAACARLEPYGERVEIMRGFSADVVRQFNANALDFVYIDGNHSFDYVMLDLIEWGRRVRPGGLICGHDYIRRSEGQGVQVVPAVQTYVFCHRVEIFFTVGGMDDGRGEPRSFFFVKP